MISSPPVSEPAAQAAPAAAVAAAEAHVPVAFDDSVRKAAVKAGASRQDAGKGIAEQVARARGVSPYRAANDLALVKGLVRELPRTLGLLVGGAISEQAALNIPRQRPRWRGAVGAAVVHRPDQRRGHRRRRDPAAVHRRHPPRHAYVSTPPPPVSEPPPRSTASLEQHLRKRLDEHIRRRAG